VALTGGFDWWRVRVCACVCACVWVCDVAAGMLALGAHGDSYEDDMQLARELMSTCYQMYAHSPSGLAPEIAEFSDAHKVT
jgi:hypothetical protein